MVLGARGASTTTDLKAVERQVLRKRRTLWLGLFVALVPLVVLVGLQSWWLSDLEKSSAIARKATLGHLLDAVVKELHVHHLKTAERALNLPPEVFSSKYFHKAGKYFAKKEVDGIKRYFAVSYLDHGSINFYDPETFVEGEPEDAAESLAVWAATAPWKILVKKGAKVETVLSVDERDPDNRIVLNPITDEDWRVVGLAGFIVDSEHFETVLLPEALGVVLGQFQGNRELIVSVRHGKRQILPVGEALNPKKDVVRRSLSFLFTDWSIALQGRISSPEGWAKTNFAVNMAMSLVLAVVLILGITISLRSASREMTLAAMKNDFVSNVSHELRTPLSSIRVFGELMRLGRVKDEAKVEQYGHYIETESRRLTQLINNILDFSRIESGQRVYTFDEACLEEVVEETLQTFAVRLSNSGFELDYIGPEDDLPLMVIDSNAIDRALANLLDNAVKYSNGEQYIGVRLQRSGDEVSVAVSDRGMGIAREEQGRIFERFHRVSTGLVHDVKGSGLGLALVQHIVSAHGGRVAVESEPGRGSTFTLHLPIRTTTGGEREEADR